MFLAICTIIAKQSNFYERYVCSPEGAYDIEQVVNLYSWWVAYPRDKSPSYDYQCEGIEELLSLDPFTGYCSALMHE